MNVKEAYTPYRLAANASFAVEGPQMGGFLCAADGVLTVANRDGVTLVDTLPVSAGVYYPLPLRFGGAGGGVVTLSSNARGTVFV